MIEKRTRNGKRRRNKNFALAWLKIASELRGLSRIWKWDGVLAGWVCFIPLCAVALGSETFCTPSLSGAAADRRLLFPSTDIIVANFRDLRWSPELLLLLMVLSTSSEVLSKSSAEIISETWAESDSPSATPPSRNSQGRNCRKERSFLGPCLSLLSRTKRFRFRGTAVTVGGGEGGGRERKKKGKTKEKHTKEEEGEEEEEQEEEEEEEEEAILLPVLHDAPDACEFPPPSRIRCCVVVAATPSPWNDVPPPPTAFTTSALSDDASVESMTSSSLLPILKESERWVQKRFSTHTQSYFLSLSSSVTRSCTYTRSRRSFKNAIQAKYPSVLLLILVLRSVLEFTSTPVRFLQDRSSDFRYNLRSCARRLFFSVVCVCVCFSFFLKVKFYHLEVTHTKDICWKKSVKVVRF